MYKLVLVLNFELSLGEFSRMRTILFYNLRGVVFNLSQPSDDHLYQHFLSLDKIQMAREI